MPILTLSAPKTMRLLSGTWPRNASNFKRSHLDKISRGRNPRTPAYRGGEGKGRDEKGFLHLKEGKAGNDREGERGMGGGKEEEGNGQRQGEFCSKVLGG